MGPLVYSRVHPDRILYCPCFVPVVAEASVEAMTRQQSSDATPLKSNACTEPVQWGRPWLSDRPSWQYNYKRLCELLNMVVCLLVDNVSSELAFIFGKWWSCGTVAEVE